MVTLDSLVAHLVDAMDSPRLLAEAYAALLDKLFALPPWSAAHPHGSRIPWKEAESARATAKQLFDSVGICMFGVREIPRWLGSTRRSFWSYLTRRYILHEYSQCQLAETYGDSITVLGIDGFAEEVRAWCARRRYGYSRLRGAVDFATHGVGDVWFALLPVDARKGVITRLKDRLLSIANSWNLERAHPVLLNTVRAS